jgi:hypothetical protein
LIPVKTMERVPVAACLPLGRLQGRASRPWHPPVPLAIQDSMKIMPSGASLSRCGVSKESEPRWPAAGLPSVPGNLPAYHDVGENRPGEGPRGPQDLRRQDAGLGLGARGQGLEARAFRSELEP